MRRWHFFLMIALLWAFSSWAQDSADKTAGKAQQATGTIGGTVLRKDTGEPIRFAHVSLDPGLEKEEDPQEPEQKKLTTVTDTAGRFVFTGLGGGAYQISVSRNGFVEEAYGARRPGEQGLPFKLDAGQHAEDLVFKLTPTGAITGHVRDENGEPVAIVQVSALQYRYEQGKRSMFPTAMVMTNDLGEFRLFNLTPGKYFVSAGTMEVGLGMVVDTEMMWSSRSSSHMVTVYYPGTTDASQALAIDVSAGGEFHGVDLALLSSKTFHIRGLVAGMKATVNGENTTAVILRKIPSFVPQRSVASVNKEGKFDISGVPSGSYEVMAFQENEGKPIIAHSEVEVAGADVEGVMLAFEAPSVVEGHLKWDDGTEPTKVQLQVGLRPMEEMYGVQGPADVNKDGSFEIKGVPPDLYSVDISGSAPDAYLRSAKYGSADAMGSFRVSGGAAGSLEIVIGAQGARVGGMVTNSDPVVVPGVWVALIPEETKQKQKRLYLSVKTDASGKYEFRGVAPGSYSLFSWDQVEEHEWEDLEFMKAFEGKGAAISVEEKENKSVDLTLIENRSKQGKP